MKGAIPVLAREVTVKSVRVMPVLMVDVRVRVHELVVLVSAALESRARRGARQEEALQVIARLAGRSRCRARV